ncbi:hypothetical protein RclHR1_00580025 [Rhizophagus clarus]|uniref:Ion transport domain-containing protein n=1 Tax=Rhizophagus clarus TaxID=94130 RepID=A0A2Z6S674_9GLOM|nr:hypothetical protein RclHR1_00580025 [Rhizophagus clarus]
MSDTSIKINNDDKIDNPHNGNLITIIQVSPNGSYVVTYSPEDHSVVGWNSLDDDEQKLKPDRSIKISDNNIQQICVSNNKELAYIYDNKLKIIDMNNEEEIELWEKNVYKNFYYCTFSAQDKLICCNDVEDRHGTYQKIILFYHIKKQGSFDRFWVIPKNFELISIKAETIYLLSNNYVYTRDIYTGTSIRLFVNEKEDEECKCDDIEISSDRRFACLRIKDKIIVYSLNLEIPIATLDNNNDTQLYNFINHTSRICLLHLLIPLLKSGLRNSILKRCLKEECQNYNNIQIKTFNCREKNQDFNKLIGHAYGISDGNVWKIKFENNILSKINFAFKNSNDLDDENDDLNIYLFNPYVDIIYELFQEAISNFNHKEEINLPKWKIKITNRKLEFQWNTKVIEFNNNIQIHHLYGSKLLNDNDILILTGIGLFIYHFNKKSKLSIKYFYYMNLSMDDDEKNKEELKKVFSNDFGRKFNTLFLPLPNYDSFKLSDEWVSYIKDNKESLLKYGAGLLSYAIEEHKLELIDTIYENCLNHFKKDLRNNIAFLKIITSKIPKYYPEYIQKYSLESTMIIDSPCYSINRNFHLRPFQYLQMSRLFVLNLYRHNQLLKLHEYNKISYYILNIWDHLLAFINPAYYALPVWCNNVNNIFYFAIPFPFYIYDKILNLITPPTSTITFMIPYIGFANYPSDYNWFKEFFKPQPNQFVKTINRDFYKTWNAEVLINSKWNSYGRVYYGMIWILFMTFLGCFTAAATIPQQHINGDTRKKLLKASIALGVIHLSVEIRQIIYNFTKWFKDHWNYFEPGFSLDKQTNNNDLNNPWNLVNTYSKVLDDGTFDSNPYIIQIPDENTNMFTNYKTAIFAMYLFLTGDSSALTNWKYINNPSLVILIILFSLLIVVYLMNLFIGLLNLEIDKDYDRVSYLVQKAEILAEIELFYLLPQQRRIKLFFPNIIYYCADVDKVRAEVKKLIKDGRWSNEFPEMKKDLFKKLNIKRNPEEADLRILLEEVQSKLKYIENL